MSETAWRAPGDSAALAAYKFAIITGGVKRRSLGGERLVESEVAQASPPSLVHLAWAATRSCPLAGRPPHDVRVAGARNREAVSRL